jgi:serine/threonine protein kinase
MAMVHRATFEAEDGGEHVVALKRLHPQLADDPDVVKALVREAKLAARLHHPNIVRIHELGRIGAVYFIAMDFVRGWSLLALLRKAFILKRPAPIGVVLALSYELCDALDHAHEGLDERGKPLHIIHRDVSPSNLLIGDDGHLKVIDFGIAKALGTQVHTSPGVVKGKLGYVAPEAFLTSQLDGRADVFAAGIVMWELLVCRRLFRATDLFDLMDKVRESEIAPPSTINPECPAELDAIVLRALERDTARRWPSAAAMRDALAAVHVRVLEVTPTAVAEWCQRVRGDSVVTGARGQWPPSVATDTATTLARSSPGDPEPPHAHTRPGIGSFPAPASKPARPAPLERAVLRLSTLELDAALREVDYLEDIPPGLDYDPPSSPYVDIRTVQAPTDDDP